MISCLKENRERVGHIKRAIKESLKNSKIGQHRYLCEENMASQVGIHMVCMIFFLLLRVHHKML